MPIQGVLRGIKAISASTYVRAAILTGIIIVMVTPLVLLAVGGRDLNTLSQPSLVWYFLGVGLMLLGGIGYGFFKFTRKAHNLSINSRRR
jgi:hypothetical protein